MKIRFTTKINVGREQFVAGQEVNLPAKAANEFVQKGFARKTPEGINRREPQSDATTLAAPTPAVSRRAGKDKADKPE